MLGDTEAPLAPSIHASIAPAPALRPGRPYARDELLHELFDATVRDHGAAVAAKLVGAGEEYSRPTSWTYDMLARRSLSMAHRLRALGVTDIAHGFDDVARMLGLESVTV